MLRLTRNKGGDKKPPSSKSDHLKSFKKMMKGNRPITIILIIFLVVTNFSEFLDAVENIQIKFSKKSISSDEKLKEDALDLSQKLYEFLLERESSRPDYDYDNWEEYNNRLSDFYSETMGQYNIQFASEVIILREEFLKRDIKDNEFEMIYEHPTNPLGIEWIAQRLAVMITKLDI